MSDLVALKEEAKKVIQSLLISAPNGLTLSMLEREFYAVTHEPFPYRKFGYFSAGDFARSLTDILYINVRNNQALFFGIANKNTDHIFQMVRKQRKPKRFCKMFQTPSPQRRNMFKPFRVKYSNQPPSASIRSAVHKLVCKHPDGFPISKLPQMYKETNGFELPAEMVPMLPDIIFRMPDIARLEFGRQNSFGGSLNVLPPKPPLDYKTLVSKKLKLRETMPKSTFQALLKSENAVNPGSSGTVVSTAVPALKEQNPEVAPLSQSGCQVSEVSEAIPNTSTSLPKLLPVLENSSKGLKLSATKRNLGPGNRAKEALSKSCDNEDLPRSCDGSHQSVPESDHNIGFGSLDAVFKIQCPPKCKKLQKEVLEVLHDFRKGLLAVELPVKYKEKFKKDMDLGELGYFSTIDFMSTLTDQVSICRPLETGDWILRLRKYETNQDKAGPSAAISESFDKVKKQLRSLLEGYPEGIDFSTLSHIYEIRFGRSFPLDKLCVSSVEEFIVKLLYRLSCIDGKLLLHSATEQFIEKEDNTPTIPIDAVGSGVCYNSPTKPSKEWDYFDIFISHVDTPSSFMFQLIGPETTVALDELMDQLEKCYSKSEGQFYRMPKHLIHVGQICATIYHGDKNWNRAIIVKEPECGLVEVLYVDYGDIASVSVHSLFLLKTSFQVLPAQMIPARLSHLQPSNMEEWHPDCKKVMLEMCRDKSLVAAVTDIDERGVLSLLICDTKKSESVDLYLNDVLIARGLAIYIHDDSTPEERKAIKDALESFPDIPKSEKPGSSANNETGVNSINNFPSNDDPPPYELHDPRTDTPTLPGGFGKAKESAKQLPERCNYRSSRKVFNEASCILCRNQCNCKAKSREDLPRNRNWNDSDLVKVHKFSDTMVFHVINYEGSLYLTSAEISAIFKPSSVDILLPMLIMKELHFEELVLANDKDHRALFAELEKHKVKGAVVDSAVKQYVTLYRACDVPSMIVDIGYGEKTDLINFFKDIVEQHKASTTDKDKDTKKLAPPCVDDADVAGPSYSSFASSPTITSKRLEKSASGSHFGDSESSVPASKQNTSSGKPSVKKSRISAAERKRYVEGDAAVDLAEFKLFIAKTNVGILEALKRNLTEKKEEYLDELLAKPSSELIELIEDVFLRMKLVDDALESRAASAEVEATGGVVSRYVRPPFTPNIAHTIVKQSETLNGDCLGVIPPPSLDPVTDIFASMSLQDQSRSGLRISSPPFKPRQPYRSVRESSDPTVTSLLAPGTGAMAPQSTPPPWFYCDPNPGFTPTPSTHTLIHRNPMPVLMHQNQSFVPSPPIAPPGPQMTQNVWVPTHFVPHNAH